MQNMAPVGEIKTVTLTQKRIMEECESVLCRSQKPTDAELPSSGSGYRGGMVVELLIPPTFNKLTIT